jgi:hypothetical protein
VEAEVLLLGLVVPAMAQMLATVAAVQVQKGSRWV